MAHHNPAPRHAATRTYIDPFLDFKRNLVFLGSFLGVLGFNLANTFSAYDLGGAGYGDLIAYFGPALLFAGFLYWPLLYMGFGVADGLAWRVFLIGLQLAASIAFVAAPPDPFWRGLAASIVQAPFWCIHHMAMVQNTTQDNRGFEVALSNFIIMLSVLTAAFTAAHFLNDADSTTALLLAFSSGTCGTLCLLIATRCAEKKTAKAYVKASAAIARDNPYMARRIISKSIFEGTTFTIAALMVLVGLSPTIMATILALRLGVMFVLSPLIGRVAHSHRKYGYAIGLALLGASWIILATSPSNPFVFGFFLILCATGIALADSSLVSGLYEMQSYASMMWCEIYLAVGRAIGFLLFVPLMYVNVTLYLFSLSGLAAILYVFNHRWQARWSDAKAM